MAAREFALIVQEKAYGVPVAVADRVLGVNAWYPRLDQSNAFSMQMKPIKGKTPRGGGYSTVACRRSDKMECVGALQGEVYPGPDGLYAKFLADAAFTTINADRDEPWETEDDNGVMPPSDLASFTVYHAIMEDDGTYERRMYNGIKVESGSFSVSDQEPRTLRFNFSLRGIRDDLNQAEAAKWYAGTEYEPASPDDTEFPAPAETDYLCGPYMMSDTVGKFSIVTARSMYSSISLNFTNSMAPNFWEFTRLHTNRMGGRQVTINTTLKRKKSPGDYQDFRDLTTMDASLEFNNGVHYLKFDLHGNNQWDDFTRDLPIGGEYVWNGVLENGWDPVDAADITVDGGEVDDGGGGGGGGGDGGGGDGDGGGGGGGGGGPE